MVWNWILYFVNNLKQFFESDHKNTLSMVMFNWSQYKIFAILILQDVYIQFSSILVTGTSLYFCIMDGPKLDFVFRK